MLACPYCDQRATTHWRKLTLSELGRGNVIKCMACRRRVGESRWNFVALLPFAYSISFIDDIPLPWFALMVIGEIVLYAALKVWFVPLKRRHATADVRRH